MFAARNMTFAAAFSPLYLNPALWLDAADASTLYTGGSLAAADGAISEWRDKSGNARHATQATGVSQPLRKTSIQNGRDVVRLDGSNDGMLTGYDITGSYTIILVSAERSGTRVLQSGTQNCVISPARSSGFACYPSVMVRNGAWSGFSEPTISTLLAPSGADFILYDNAVNVTTSSALTVNFGTLVLGYGGTANEGSDCDIYEILVFPTVLGTTERQAVESYLNAKWAIY